MGEPKVLLEFSADRRIIEIDGDRRCQENYADQYELAMWRSVSYSANEFGLAVYDAMSVKLAEALRERDEARKIARILHGNCPGFTLEHGCGGDEATCRRRCPEQEQCEICDRLGALPASPPAEPEER